MVKATGPLWANSQPADGYGSDDIDGHILGLHHAYMGQKWVEFILQKIIGPVLVNVVHGKPQVGL